MGLVAGTAVVMAYPPPGATGAETAGCTTVASGGSCSYSFQFATAGATVAFAVSGVAGASVSPTSATTDANGVASTVLSAGTGCGTATITATSGGATGTAAVNITCASTAGVPLPNTSTGAPGPSPWAIVIAALAALIVAGGALTLRQTRRTH